MPKHESIMETESTEGKNPPATLYKYCSMEAGAEIFRSGHLKLQSVFDFNDPFEPRFHIKYPDSNKELLRVMNKTPFGNSVIGTALYLETLEEKKKYGNKLPPDAQEALREIGISCFSATPSSILMWGHYADKHKGVCLGFRYNVLHSHFDVRKMKYTDDVPVLELSEERHRPHPLTSKASCWEYEQEWRIAVSGWIAKKKMRLPPDAISHVIFGVNAPENAEMNFVSDIVKRSDIQIQKAQIVEGKYELNFPPYTWRRSE